MPYLFKVYTISLSVIIPNMMPWNVCCKMIQNKNSITVFFLLSARTHDDKVIESDHARSWCRFPAKQFTDTPERFPSFMAVYSHGDARLHDCDAVSAAEYSGAVDACILNIERDGSLLFSWKVTSTVTAQCVPMHGALSYWVYALLQRHNLLLCFHFQLSMSIFLSS